MDSYEKVFNILYSNYDSEKFKTQITSYEVREKFFKPDVSGRLYVRCNISCRMFWKNN